jgi:Na+/H+ antiporter NhaD/arsenite permease-like protein
MRIRREIIYSLFSFIFVTLIPLIASGSEGGSTGGHINLGEVLPIWSCIPFACMLLSIALFPLLAPNIWHHHFGKISAFWALSIAVPFVITYHGLALHQILHIIIADYIPFIILLWSLYTVSGGILLRGTLVGTPAVNTSMLLIGTLLAS